MRNQTRRQFIASSIATTAALTLGIGPCPQAETSWEGVYTDRFTYRQGETIRAYAAVQSAGTLPVLLYRQNPDFRVVDSIDTIASCLIFSSPQ